MLYGGEGGGGQRSIVEMESLHQFISFHPPTRDESFPGSFGEVLIVLIKEEWKGISTLEFRSRSAVRDFIIGTIFFYSPESVLVPSRVKASERM